MEKVVYRFALDAARPGTQAQLFAKKGDTDTRAVAITVKNGGAVYGSGAAAAVLKAKKPDGSTGFYSAEADGAVVSAVLPNGLFSLAGSVQCELCLYGSDGETLSTPRFEIFVEDMLYSDTSVEVTDEYSALVDVMGSLSEFAEDAETEEAARAEAETQRALSEDGRTAAEAQRTLSEDGRTAAETARAEAETARASAEAERESSETERADAETARASAEEGRAEAEALREGSETVRTDAEAARIAAESVRVSSELLREAGEDARRQDSAEAIEAAETAAQRANAAALACESIADGLDMTWEAVLGKPETFAPSAHSHEQSDVTGLSTALAGKSDALHSHAYSAITGKPATFAPSAHTHAQADVTGLAAVLSGKAATAHTHAQSDVTGLSSVLEGKADVSVERASALTAAGWVGASAPYTQAVAAAGLTATSKGTIGVAQTATAAQREAVRSAMLSVTAQAANSVTITADGIKPAVDIPIVVLEVG